MKKTALSLQAEFVRPSDKVAELEADLVATGARQRILTVMALIETYTAEDRTNLAEGVRLEKAAMPALQMLGRKEPLSEADRCALSAFSRWYDAHGQHQAERNVELQRSLSAMFQAVRKATAILTDAKALGLSLRSDIDFSFCVRLERKLRPEQEAK